MADSEILPLSTEENDSQVLGAVPSLPSPLTPLIETYSYHSPKPTEPGPYIMGVDEAGRGPALGPMVYGVAYCPESYKEQLEELGFADSKTLSHDSRSNLLEILDSDPKNLAWSVRVISPQAISNGMLRRPPTNLNKQAENATITLIREVLDQGIELSEVYVDALGNTTTYEKYLSGLFPDIKFTVTAKADSKYKIVGGASVAAKVTRDAWVTGWVFEEHESNPRYSWPEERGSGYPSDPKTQVWLRDSLEPTFGFPSLVRFSWATVKVALEKYGHAVKWTDEGHASLVKAFESAKGRDMGRCILAKELSLKSEFLVNVLTILQNQFSSPGSMSTFIRPSISAASLLLIITRVLHVQGTPPQEDAIDNTANDANSQPSSETSKSTTSFGHSTGNTFSLLVLASFGVFTLFVFLLVSIWVSRKRQEVCATELELAHAWEVPDSRSLEEELVNEFPTSSSSSVSVSPDSVFEAYTPPHRGQNQGGWDHMEAEMTMTTRSKEVMTTTIGPNVPTSTTTGFDRGLEDGLISKSTSTSKSAMISPPLPLASRSILITSPAREGGEGGPLSTDLSSVIAQIGSVAGISDNSSRVVSSSIPSSSTVIEQNRQSTLTPTPAQGPSYINNTLPNKLSQSLSHPQTHTHSHSLPYTQLRPHSLYRARSLSPRRSLPNPQSQPESSWSTRVSAGSSQTLRNSSSFTRTLNPSAIPGPNPNITSGPSPYPYSGSNPIFSSNPDPDPSPNPYPGFNRGHNRSRSSGSPRRRTTQPPQMHQIRSPSIGSINQLSQTSYIRQINRISRISYISRISRASNISQTSNASYFSNALSSSGLSGVSGLTRLSELSGASTAPPAYRDTVSSRETTMTLPSYYDYSGTGTGVGTNVLTDISASVNMCMRMETEVGDRDRDGG
ncbi:ribonuclease H2 subunit A [Pyrrhoderma noxium]|uniref:Ribonuclease n=1 Tax=Pyrrhoderma noxium TaxID=2282107 RepID=A0A286U949_9AGAM|nr:ribonuclease H2 subunit A [Pyrrhoderma noxium]